MGKIFNVLNQKEKRRVLRNSQTNAEKILWERLRKKQLGVRFLRQYGIGPYIADFYCPSKKLVVEVDGGYHLEKNVQEYDQERTNIMKEFDLLILRFTNEQVMSDLEKVCEEIKDFLDKNSPQCFKK